MSGQIYLSFVAVFKSQLNSTDTEKGFIGVKVFYMECALVYLKHIFMICGGPDIFTFTAIFMKCGVKSSLGGKECCILKMVEELLYRTISGSEDAGRSLDC